MNNFRGGNDRLANYVPVAERVTAAAPEIQLLQSDSPVMLNDVLGYIRVTITLVDGRTATGIAQFRLDATKGAQATNPLEDAETSAVGRALGFLGYSSNRSIATREDVERAQAMQARQPPPLTPPPPPEPERQQLIDELKAVRTKLHEVSLGALPAKPNIADMNVEQLRHELQRTRIILAREQGPETTAPPQDALFAEDDAA